MVALAAAGSIFAKIEFEGGIQRFMSVNLNWQIFLSCFLILVGFTLSVGIWRRAPSAYFWGRIFGWLVFIVTIPIFLVLVFLLIFSFGQLFDIFIFFFIPLAFLLKFAWTNIVLLPRKTYTLNYSKWIDF